MQIYHASFGALQGLCPLLLGCCFLCLFAATVLETLAEEGACIPVATLGFRPHAPFGAEAVTGAADVPRLGHTGTLASL